jgi:hypothetical protein
MPPDMVRWYSPFFSFHKNTVYHHDLLNTTTSLRIGTDQNELVLIYPTFASRKHPKQSASKQVVEMAQTS